MRTLSRVVAALLMILTVVYGAAGRISPQDLTRIKPLKGYSRAIAGERLNYYCFNPVAETALLTRCTSGDMAIEWETEPLPPDSKEDAVVFKWIVSFSTTTSSADRQFDFLINNEKTFVIKTTKGATPQEWSLKAGNGAELMFQLVKEDAAKDANGYMYLKVPVARYPKGAPLRLRVVGEKANSSDWFMTFAYDLRDADTQVLPLPFLVRAAGGFRQSVCVAVMYARLRGEAAIAVDGGTREMKELLHGSNIFEFSVPAVEAPREIVIDIAVDGGPSEATRTMLRPVKRRTIHLLPHAHTDIGYTDLQPDVLKKHVKNIYDALALIRKTASFPPEARFKWNTEVAWAVEAFLKNAAENDRKEFLAAVKSGSMSVQALYTNNLTGIMRPEEFFRLSEYTRSLRGKYGITVTTAMMSDIPGMTWNMVPTVAQAGIKYFSSGPNGQYLGGDRTGHTNRSWADRPFYWTSPSGTERILYWTTGFGYSSFFAGVTGNGGNRMTFLRGLRSYFEWLDMIAYPYDVIQMRHTIGGDNGTVDPDLPQYVKSWNEKYVSPKIVISTAEALFSELENRYGSVLPVFGGDFTPYWEDGAASTAYELGVNRTTAEQLVQSEALAAILAPASYDADKFSDAWRSVLLFDEHTWGAHNSINDPDSPFVVQQWEIKRRFAHDAAAAAEALRQKTLAVHAGQATSGGIEIINTNSWDRTDLVILPGSESAIGDVVRDDTGKDVPSQRLTGGELAFLAQDVPGLGTKRFTLHAGKSQFTSSLRASGTTLSDGNLEITLDPATGSITRLHTASPLLDFVDTLRGGGLNEYLYVAGLDAKETLGNGRPSIIIKERGPLVATLAVTSDAPGCNTLTREVRLISGTGRVDLTNTIDRKKVRVKEGVHFGFPFAVPDAVVRIDLGFGVIRPEADQLPGSCKDYYSAQRWVDVSNQDFGVTLTVNEAPLIEVGDLNSELPSPRNPDWKKSQWSSPRLASYVMNNYWHTNYRADQEGLSTYHYSIKPHGLFNQLNAARLGIERSQPLVVRRVGAGEPRLKPLLKVNPGGVIVSYVRPLNDGAGYLVRLFNAGGSPEHATVAPGDPAKSVYLSSPLEEKGQKVSGINIPPNGIVTVRVE